MSASKAVDKPRKAVDKPRVKKAPVVKAAEVETWLRGWKVVRLDPDLGKISLFVFDEASVVTYEVGKITRPRPNRGDLCVFAEKSDIPFNLVPPEERLRFPCEYLPSDATSVWSVNGLDIPLNSLLAGTRLAKAVRLLSVPGGPPSDWASLVKGAKRHEMLSFAFQAAEQPFKECPDRFKGAEK